MENSSGQSGKDDSLGIVALIVGIPAIITSFIPCFGIFAIILGGIAIILGAIGLSKAKKAAASTTLSKVGLILGIVSIVIVIIRTALLVGAMGSVLVSHKDEITKAIDSVAIESAKVQDSLDAIEITTDTIKVEETK